MGREQILHSCPWSIKPFPDGKLPGLHTYVVINSGHSPAQLTRSAFVHKLWIVCFMSLFPAGRTYSVYCSCEGWHKSHWWGQQSLLKLLVLRQSTNPALYRQFSDITSYDLVWSQCNLDLYPRPFKKSCWILPSILSFCVCVCVYSVPSVFICSCQDLCCLGLIFIVWSVNR